ncbi:MAG: SHOCT domain-containing protein [Bacteroidales bacterium]
MGILFFILFGLIVIGILMYFKKNAPKNRIDKTAWDPSEREALEVLKQRLATGDISEEEYEELKKRIEQKS